MTTSTDMRKCIFLVILLIINVLSAMSQEMFMNVFSINEKQCGDKPMLLQLTFSADYQGDTKASVVLSVNDGKQNVYWESFPLQHDFALEKLIPSHLLQHGPLKCYVFNPKKQTIRIDDVNYVFEDMGMPSYVPENIDVSQPISLYLNDNQYLEWEILSADPAETTYLNENEFARTIMVVRHDNDSTNLRYEITAEFLKDMEISRFALMMHFDDGEFTVYRSNMHVDTIACQEEYYLDQEGFSFRKGERQLNLYHPKSLSSMQLDVRTSTAILNIDYELDHPMIHYPARIDTIEYYENVSKRKVKAGDTMKASFNVGYTQHIDLPRFMPVWDGYESSIIFTEHADWTDIRTHRAVCFGNESVTCADSAVGGFVYYGIPVTKSVFYNNPDMVVNLIKNREFPDSHCTIKTDSVYFDFLKQLKDKGFDICLHSPEQYTTTRENLYEALEFMKENFGSPSWIDHGYNNSFITNREDLVCDGLNKYSAYYALEAWRKNGVRYLWNAAYEEMKPFDDYNFSFNLQRPYPFFGDALPHPRYMKAPFDANMLMWTTDYTLEPGDHWNYYLSQNLLENIVESRSAFINHVYSAWVTTERGFWDVEDGQIVAKPDMNQAFERIAKLRDQHLMLPTTVDKFLSYQEQLQNVDYQYDNEGNVVLLNNNDDTIHGFTLISKSPMTLIENQEVIPFSSRNSNDEYIIWFDFGPHERITIK